jgi:hypothetical protein
VDPNEFFFFMDPTLKLFSAPYPDQPPALGYLSNMHFLT